nr:hypothetical protein [Tanacetum cinerariifolium]
SLGDIKRSPPYAATITSVASPPSMSSHRHHRRHSKYQVRFRCTIEESMYKMT